MALKRQESLTTAGMV